MTDGNGETAHLLTRYFLDWRPIGALPAAASQIVRPRDLSRAQFRAFVEGVDAPARSHDLIDPFHRAAILARQDGLFIVRLTVREEEFNSEDWEELATLVCACVKAQLGHTHDVHDGRKGPPADSPKKAPKPDSVLIVEPVELAAEQWKDAFASQSFDDELLRQAECVPPPGAPEKDQPRNALIRLRRAHLRLFEEIIAILATNRNEEINDLRFPRALAVLTPLALAAVIATLALVLSPTPSAEVFRDWRTWKAVALGGALLFVFAYYLRSLSFDLPRVRLLRASAAYFSYVNPLNRVVHRVFSNPANGATAESTTAERTTDDFTDLIRVLQIKVEGEAHRASVNQLWVTLALAAYSVLIAALALPALSLSASAQAAAGRQPASITAPHVAAAPQPAPPATR